MPHCAEGRTGDRRKALINAPLFILRPNYGTLLDNNPFQSNHYFLFYSSLSIRNQKVWSSCIMDKFILNPVRAVEEDSHIVSKLSKWNYKNVNRKVQGVPQSQASEATAILWRQEEETKGKKLTNAREAHRPGLSSPSELITMLNRTEKKTRTKSRK